VCPCLRVDDDDLILDRRALHFASRFGGGRGTLAERGHNLLVGGGHGGVAGAAERAVVGRALVLAAQVETKSKI
jgi:predicted Rossmann-fold nucleotide-binding protein